MAAETEDEELAAITTLLRVLTPLAADARNNVIEYVFRRLGLTAPTFSILAQPVAPQAALQSPPAEPTPATPPTRTTDLRSLRDMKEPKSVNQMVAVLAYYLATLAPTEERRDYLVAEDIKKYFPQANFPLPTGPHNMTLVNAKNAGYLDVLRAGQYRLNPVGHNLVTHKLPRVEGPAPSRGAHRAKRKVTKKKKAKR